MQKLKTQLSEQEETINELVLRLSKLEKIEATDKSVIVDIECKLNEKRGEMVQLTDQLLAYKNKESSLGNTITSLQTQVLYGLLCLQLFVNVL